VASYPKTGYALGRQGLSPIRAHGYPWEDEVDVVGLVGLMTRDPSKSEPVRTSKRPRVFRVTHA